MKDNKKKTIWFVGGEDIRMRIPLLSLLRNQGFDVGALGTEDSQPFDDADIYYKKYYLNRWVSPFSDRRTIQELTSIFKKVKHI